MNMRFDLKYLSGGDAAFGPNYGGATIYTVTRKATARNARMSGACSPTSNSRCAARAK
jgi:ABC-type proline/glycine betaine transport system substrate-binding protein